MNAPTRISCPLCQASIKAPALPPRAVCTCPKCGGKFRLGGEEQAAPVNPATTDPATSATPPNPFETTSSPPPRRPSHPDLLPPVRRAAPQPSPETYPELVSPEENEPQSQDVAITCQLCGSRYYADRSKIGQSATCPDCHTPNLIRNPPPKPKKAKVVLSDEDDYRFVDEPLPERPVAAMPIPAAEAVPTGDLPSAVVPMTPAVVEAPLPKGEGNVSKELAAAMIAKAAEELGEPQAGEIQDEMQSFFHGTITAVAQGQGIALLLVLTVGCSVMAMIFRYVRGQFDDGLSLEHILGVGAMTIGLIALPVILGPLAAACQAIVQDTANGLKRVESWPTLSFFDWLGEAALTMAAGFAAAAPGILLVSPAVYSMRYPGLIIPGVLMFSVWLLFPVLFLSMAEAGSVLAFATPKIIKSFTKSGERWFLFYFASAVLAFTAYFAVAVLLETKATLLVPVCCAVLIAELFIYSRWLGRLAWFISKDEQSAEERAKRLDDLVKRVA